MRTAVSLSVFPDIAHLLHFSYTCILQWYVLSNHLAVRVEEILQQNFSDLLEAVPNPVKLANDLWTAQMISLTVKNDVLNNRWMSDYEKASKLLNEATKLLKAFSQNPDRQMKDFKTLCQVLQRQGDPVLSSLVDSMLEASGQFSIFIHHNFNINKEFINLSSIPL